MTKCDFYIHQLNTQTTNTTKKIENYIDAESSFSSALHAIWFSRGLFQWWMNPFIAWHPKPIHMCVCLYLYAVCIHWNLLFFARFFENAHFNFKFHLVCGQFRFTFYNKRTSQTKHQINVMIKFFALHTARARKSALHAHTRTANANSSWLVWCAVCLTPIRDDLHFE